MASSDSYASSEPLLPVVSQAVRESVEERIKNNSKAYLPAAIRQLATENPVLTGCILVAGEELGFNRLPRAVAVYRGLADAMVYDMLHLSGPVPVVSEILADTLLREWRKAMKQKDYSFILKIWQTLRQDNPQVYVGLENILKKDAEYLSRDNPKNRAAVITSGTLVYSLLENQARANRLEQTYGL